jgi:hypothetical protein
MLPQLQVLNAERARLELHLSDRNEPQHAKWLNFFDSRLV